MKTWFVAILLAVVTGVAGCKKSPNGASTPAADKAAAKAAEREAKAAQEAEAMKAARAAIPEPTEVLSDAAKDRRQLKADARRMFLAKEYDQLEHLAQTLRDSKAAYADGQWRLAGIYQGLDHPAQDSEAGWKAHIAAMKAWIKARPEIVTPRVALARVLVSYAWVARGSGYADTVTQRGAQLMAERLAEGRQVLLDARKLNAKCPVLFSAGQQIALGEGWDKKTYDKWMAEGLALEPTYHDYYFRKAYFLQPRWYGEEGEWEKFAEEAAEKKGGDEGDVLYAQLVWYIRELGLYKSIFNTSTISWPRSKSGFLVMMKQRPDDLQMVSEFCIQAGIAGDTVQARTLFAENVKGQVDPTIWDMKYYRQCLDYCFSN